MYVVLSTILLFFSQGVIGMVNSLQQKCCKEGGHRLGCCGTMGLLIRTLDRFLNPWSSQRHASGERLLNLSLAVEGTKTQNKVLANKMSFLDMRVQQIGRHLDLPGSYETPDDESSPRLVGKVKGVTFKTEVEESADTEFTIPHDDSNSSEYLPLINQVTVHQEEELQQTMDLAEHYQSPGPLKRVARTAGFLGEDKISLVPEELTQALLESNNEYIRMQGMARRKSPKNSRAPAIPPPLASIKEESDKF